MIPRQTLRPRAWQYARLICWSWVLTAGSLNEAMEAATSGFPSEIAEIQVTSSLDKTPQPSLFYFPNGESPSASPDAVPRSEEHTSELQ